MKKYQIVKREELTELITMISVYAPLIAKKAKAGQFIILRVDEEGERIPLTISSTTDELVTVVFQKVGATTLALDKLEEGECLHDFVGPLGVPTEVEGLRKAHVRAAAVEDISVGGSGESLFELQVAWQEVNGNG